MNREQNELCEQVFLDHPDMKMSVIRIIVERAYRTSTNLATVKDNLDNMIWSYGLGGVHQGIQSHRFSRVSNWAYRTSEMDDD